MSQFSRRARWLNQLFPQSAAPQETDPGIRSDDVSLVQPYDGGGIAFQDIGTFCRRFVIPTGITDTIDMILNDANTVFRVYALHVQQLLGTDASVAVYIMSPNGDSVYVAWQDVLQASTRAQPFDKQADFKILGPGQTLTAQTLGGGADSSFGVGVYGVSAPLGTVFVP